MIRSLACRCSIRELSASQTGTWKTSVRNEMSSCIPTSYYNLKWRCFLQSNKYEMSRSIRISYYRISRYTIFFVKLCCIDMHISSYIQHLDRVTYNCLQEKSGLGLEVKIQILSSGAFSATTVGTCYPYTILTTAYRAICYHTLRSEWRLHQRSREIPATETDTEVTLLYSF
jgi:hypothetical protein